MKKIHKLIKRYVSNYRSWVGPGNLHLSQVPCRSAAVDWRDHTLRNTDLES